MTTVMERLRQSLAENARDPFWLAKIALGLLVILYLSSQSGYGLFLAVASLCYALAAMSVVALTGWAGQLSLAQAAMTGIGAFTMGMLTGTDVTTGAGRLPFIIGLVLVPLIVAPIAVLVGLPALRVRGIHLALVTLGAAYAADTNIFTSSDLTGYAENLNVERPSLFGMDLSSDRAYFMVVLVVLVLVVWALKNVSRSRLGRAMYAVRDSELAAAVLGINVARVKMTSFALAGSCAGLAGALYAPVVGNVYSVFRTFDVGKSLFILALVVVGGLRSLGGAFLAGILYIYLPEEIAEFVNPVLTQAVAGFGLALIILFAPDGLVGVPRQVYEAVRRRRRGAVDDESPPPIAVPEHDVPIAETPAPPTKISQEV